MGGDGLRAKGSLCLHYSKKRQYLTPIQASGWVVQSSLSRPLSLSSSRHADFPVRPTSSICLHLFFLRAHVCASLPSPFALRPTASLLDQRRPSGWSCGTILVGKRLPPGLHQAARLSMLPISLRPFVVGPSFRQPPLRGGPRASDWATRPSPALFGEPSTRRPPTPGCYWTPPRGASPLRRPPLVASLPWRSPANGSPTGHGDETSHGAVGA